VDPAQIERLAHRLRALASLRQVYEVIEDLGRFEEAASAALPFFTIKSILQAFAWRLEGLPPAEGQFERIWVAMQQQLVPSMTRVLDALVDGRNDEMVRELKVVVGQWTMLRAEMR
jgi:hypothetical protein